MKKNAIIVCVILILYGSYVYKERASSIPVSKPITPIDLKSYTFAEVSSHANSQSCWSIINGNVYDLTSWIGQHPGGPFSIEKLCGVDGSNDFNNKHGGQPRAERELASFLIGTVK